ncbi:hypothetical protein B5F36_03605 [Anaerofilum sp. An201]|nr:DUF402 domain-containing protein [Anaerofilum sp. An201]OUP04582.1 hypothetical protein B5F36_03605 [Anaerofilum sp. An201]
MKDNLVVKHVRLTFDEWNRSIRYKTVYLTEDAQRCCALICIEQVKDSQIWNIFGGEITVADDGYTWLVIAQKQKNYVVTMYMNSECQPLLWYIDMTDGMGKDPDGVAFYNDIFLDLLVSPTGEFREDDRDELEAALAQGVISDVQYHLTNTTADSLKRKITSDPHWLQRECQAVLDTVRREIAEGRCRKICSS